MSPRPASVDATVRPHPVVAMAPLPRATSGRRISDAVVAALTAAIRDLRLPPGAAVSESELAQQLGVSRTPIREAIARLVDRDLLWVVAQVGTRVSLIDVAEVERAVFIRCALEVAAYREACQVEARDLEPMRQVLELQGRAQLERDVSLFYETDEDLHHQVFRVSGFDGVWDVVRRSKLHLDRLRRLILPDAIAGDELLEEHRLIAELLERRDVEAGVALITKHAHRVLDELPEVRARFPEYFTG